MKSLVHNGVPNTCEMSKKLLMNNELNSLLYQILIKSCYKTKCKQHTKAIIWLCHYFCLKFGTVSLAGYEQKS